MPKTKKTNKFYSKTNNSSDVLTSRNNTNNTNTNYNTNTNNSNSINIITSKKTQNVKTLKSLKSKTLKSKSFNSLESKSFTIRFSTNKFFSRTQSRIKRGPKPKITKQDLFALFISDNKNKLIQGKTIYNDKLDKYIFTESDTKCICENIFSTPQTELDDDCECDNIKTYSSQGKSGAKIHSIRCKGKQEILKTIGISNYYIKMRTQTNNYMFIEMDGFSIQTLINTYVHRELPNNTINIINSGTCVNKDKSKIDKSKIDKSKIDKSKIDKSKKSKMQGYNLMEEADLGSGRQFFMKLLNGDYDDEFNINDEDMRYISIVNMLLQVVLIIGHLQASSLEFFHGDYKPENVFVKRCDKKTLNQFTFKVFGKMIKVKNLGFAVLIADFDRSSLTISDDEFSTKKYRIISPILFKPLLTSNVNNIIRKYGDIDPDNITNINYEKHGVKFEKLFLSRLIPRKMDPTITILRSAGVKLFRDFDLYTFFIRLLETENVRKYIKEKRIDVTIMSFMSKKFISELFSKPAKEISQNESAYVAVEILNKIKEPMYNVFTDNYITTLEALNYRLFT